MSTYTKDWWPNVRWMVRNYPARKKEFDALGDQMPPAKLQELNAVSDAVNILATQKGGSDKLEFIRRLYWSGDPPLIESAAFRSHISTCSGKNWNKQFLQLVGNSFGYSVPEGDN